MISFRSPLLVGAVLAAVACAAPLEGGEIDRCLPEDSEVVISVNLRQIFDSKVMKEHGLAAAREALRDMSEVDDVLKDLGLDPFKDLDRVTMASPTGGDRDRGLIIAQGRFDLAKIRAKGEEAAQSHSENLKVLQVPDGKGGKERVYQVTAPEMEVPLFVAIPTAKMLLVSPGKDYIVDALRKLRADSPPVLKNKGFQRLLEKMDERQSLSLAAVSQALQKGVGKHLPEEATSALRQLEALGGGLTVSEDVKAEIIVTAKSAQDARELRESITQSLGLLTGLSGLADDGKEKSPGLELAIEAIRSLRVTGKGAVVVIKGRITSDVLEDVFKKKP